MSKRVTGIEETQERDWQTQVQQRDKIQKIETQMMQQHQTMQQNERDAVNTQAGERNRMRQAMWEQKRV